MEENDGEKEVNRAKDRSPSPGVKSTAVVKYTAVQSPVHFSQLQCNTDLNMPPSNWGAAIDSYGLKQILTEESGLPRMAHMFPDVVGNVDVIAGAECIKKLLKLPYQPNGTVSMMVHRIENTLLLDNFDVYDYLMKSEWSWLKDFFYENILKTMSEKDKMMLSIEKKPSSALQLTNKFLCHSVASQPKRESAAVPACLDAPLVPEPPAPPQQPPFNRNVLWTFEDIHMLIGSDLPIFGGDERPCVSLRLRDAREPINVLTGIDYWLDNLMCNVPEVLMCYHLDGIVQQYEPMKTEELPHVDCARFSPKVIRNVAQNILSFLKSNATKAGHTYWLFKGPRDDVVKLYDLTSLCPEPGDSPFTTPVAMLLYRVARNMRLTNRTRHVKQLLENALKLLKPETHPQLCASARYMLAELHVPARTDPAAPRFTEDTSTSDTESEDIEPDFPETEEDCGQLVQSRGLALRDIGARTSDKPEQKAKSDKDGNNLGTSPPDRCGKALKHALEGLLALHHITIDKCKEEERERLRQQIIAEELHPNMANPREPIRMDYEPIRKNQIVKEHQSRSRRRKRERKVSENSLVEKKDKNAILIRKESSFKHEPDKSDNFAWKLHLKTLLYENICLSYATLAEYSYANQQYGFSLKYIEMASKCQKLLSNLIIKSRVVDASCLIGRVGDNYFQLSKHWSKLEKYKKQFETDHDIDRRLRIEIENDMIEETDGAVRGEEFDLAIALPCSSAASLELSLAHYSRALLASDKRGELERRLASVHNELAVLMMHEGQQLFTKYQEEEDASSAAARAHLAQSAAAAERAGRSLQAAAALFQQVQDVPNLALLHCNKARFMRFKAHCTAGISETDKRNLYTEAEEEYQSALKLIGNQELPVKDLVLWELSCHLTTRACRMQDEGAYEANEVSAALNQALKACQLGAGPRQHLYQFRAALLQHRLASLNHALYRQTTEEGPKRRSLFNATRGHYEHAANTLAALEDAHTFLTVRLEHVALLETQAHVSPNLKLKSLQTALQLLRQCQSVMKIIFERDDQVAQKPDENDESTLKNEHKLLSLYENRLNHILKSVIQYCRSKSNKDYERLTVVYKKLYCESLKIKKSDDVKAYAKSVFEVLAAMSEIDKEL